MKKEKSNDNSNDAYDSRMVSDLGNSRVPNLRLLGNVLLEGLITLPFSFRIIHKLRRETHEKKASISKELE